MADPMPSRPEPEPTDAEVQAFTTAWEAARQAVGPEDAPAGTKTRAGLRAAFAERERAHWEAHRPCLAELYSWEYFRPEQMDGYYMRCDRLGPHSQHVNSDTGATWPSVVVL